MKKLFLLLIIMFIPFTVATRWFFVGDAAFSKYSVILDGADELVTCGDVLDETGDDAFSLSLWIKNNTWIGVDTPFITKRDGVDSGYIFYANQGILSFTMEDGVGARSSIDTDSAFTGTDWTLLTVTYDGSRDIRNTKFYINSAEEPSTFSYKQTWGDSSSPADFEIGGWSSYNRFADAIIGDTYKFPWEISGAEVAELYNNGVELDMEDFSAWNTFKASARSLWVTWEADDLTGGTGSVTDLTDNSYSCVGVNTESSDKIADVPE